MAATKEVVATGFIIFRQLRGKREYLLLKASYEKFLWTPPKGHVDPGEEEFQTALRETEEEAGFRSEHLNILSGFESTLRYLVREKPKRVVYWLAELKVPETPVKLSDEHNGYAWLSLDEALSYSRFPDFQKTLKDADTFISKL